VNETSITDANEIFARELAANELSSLDVDTYLTCATDHVQAVPNAVDGGGSTRLFEFMRLAKAHTDLMRLSSNDALPKVEKWLGYGSISAGVTEMECNVSNVYIESSSVARIEVWVSRDGRSEKNALFCHDKRLFADLAQSQRERTVCRLWYKDEPPEIIRILSVGGRNFPMSVNQLLPDRWSKVFDIKVADAVPAFTDGWERVRYPRGWLPLNLAIARARHEPLVVANANEPGYTEFINIAKRFSQGLEELMPESWTRRATHSRLPAISGTRTSQGWCSGIHDHGHRWLENQRDVQTLCRHRQQRHRCRDCETRTSAG
jgi:hypothetical protein